MYFIKPSNDSISKDLASSSLNLNAQSSGGIPSNPYVTVLNEQVYQIL